mmetsp:Transcript_132633/g.412404  ORF Transcript_132633/g.412404 Transcript_132633/m.412404 type:complete len:242 (-) Transcript_132633:914-1639(-)
MLIPFWANFWAAHLRESLELFDMKITRLPSSMRSLIFAMISFSSARSVPCRLMVLLLLTLRTLSTTPPTLKMKVSALRKSSRLNVWDIGVDALRAVSSSAAKLRHVPRMDRTNHSGSTSFSGNAICWTANSRFSLRQALPKCMSSVCRLKPRPSTVCTFEASSSLLPRSTVFTQEPSVSCRPTNASGSSSCSGPQFRVHLCLRPSPSKPAITKALPSKRITLTATPRMLAGLKSLSAPGQE